MRHHVGYFHAALAALAESERAGEDLVGVALLVNLDALRNALPVALLQLRFGVEQIHLTRPAVLHEMHDRLRLTVEVSAPRLQVARSILLRRGKSLLCQQPAQRQPADAEA